MQLQRRTLLFTLCALPFASKAAVADPKSASSIPAAYLIQPADLAAVLASAAAPKPKILQVGFRTLYAQSHIPGAEYAGAARDDEGLSALRERVAKLPKNEAVVIYCGCCPWSHCPKIAAAFTLLHDLRFTQLKVLYIAENFGSDWVDKGYPVAKES